jgi:GNAT superfamily N-acetyltransferase
MSIESEPANPSDAPLIAGLIREAKAQAMPWLAVPHTLAEDEAWVAGVLLPEHEVRVARRTDDKTIVGVIACSPGWIEQLYVSPAAQGNGIGARLLRTAQDEASGQLELWTFQRNARARSFYERHGFVAVDETSGDNEENEPDVRYRWLPQR